MAEGSETQRPIVVVRKVKKVVGGHHGGAWKIAYADFVTAMMAFFMLLWLISSSEKVSLEGLAEYFSANPAAVKATAGAESMFGGKTIGEVSPGQPGSPSPGLRSKAEVKEAKQAEDAKRESATTDVPDAAQRVLADELRVTMAEIASVSSMPNQVAVTVDREGVRIQLMDSNERPMFKSGTNQLFPYAENLMKRIAAKLVRGTQRIAVEGHTDAQGGSSDPNWNLSGARAQTARKALVDGGITPDRIAEVVALAGNEPLFPDHPEKPENRRITLVILSERSASPRDTTFRR